MNDFLELISINLVEPSNKFLVPSLELTFTNCYNMLIPIIKKIVSVHVLPTVSVLRLCDMANPLVFIQCGLLL